MQEYPIEFDALPYLYLQQLARSHRALIRYLDATREECHFAWGKYSEASDQYHAAFQTIWHVKDWLFHDETVDEQTRVQCVKAGESHRDLRIACDLANFSKHLVVTGDRTGAEHNGLIIYNESTGTRFEHRIQLRDGSEIGAYEQAVRSLNAWTRILRANGLPTIRASAI